MSVYKRTQQWTTFARTWHIYDATWQNPFRSADKIIKYLSGRNKPIYHSLNDCGDHVIVINCKDIALPGDEWKRRVYFHHTGYPGGASWTLAWELHKKNPTMIMWKAVYNQMEKNLLRRGKMQRLHLYDKADVPSHLMKNVTNQISQCRPIPKNLDAYSEREIEEFPKLLDYPEDYLPIDLEDRKLFTEK